MVPAAPGTLAFVKINSMGASMSEISQQYIIPVSYTHLCSDKLQLWEQYD